MPIDKHLLNTPTSLVVESLQGLCALNPNVQLDVANKVVYQKNPDRSKVALICGGGSGHEPAHAGFVGTGMLNAAVCGNVFASPNAGQVRKGIELVDNNKGTLIIVKNYTGDVLNFGLAKEHYAASHHQKADKLKFLNVGEDVSVGRTQGSIVGRRGLAGTVLVYKIAGALANQGATLDEVYSVAEWIASRMGTVGVGLDHCHVPGTEPSKSHLATSEVEIGMGIHNEPGHTRVSPIPPLNDLVAQMFELITSTTDKDRSFLPFKNKPGEDDVVLLVNNLGGISELELSGITGAATSVLEKKGVRVHRVLAGSFMTSLNMPGFSLTLLLLPHSSDRKAPSATKILSLLDEKADAPGWKWSSGLPPAAPSSKVPLHSAATATIPTAGDVPQLIAANPDLFIIAIQNACRALIGAEPDITRMDSIAGDGDCGLTLKSGAEAVLKAIQSGKITGENVIGSVVAISQAADEYMDGTSGALYSIFFSALAQGLVSSVSGTRHSEANTQVWTSALNIALDRLYTYTRARPPSRTLIDPLTAFVTTLPNGFTSAVAAADKAAEATKDAEARAGRSAYVDSEQLKKERIPDPGAWGVKTILNGLSSH